VPLPCLRRTATELGQDGLVVLQVLIVVLDIPHGRVIYRQSFFGVLLGSELKCLSDRKPLAETGQDIVVVRHFRRGSLREPGRDSRVLSRYDFMRLFNRFPLGDLRVFAARAPKLGRTEPLSLPLVLRQLDQCGK